MKNKVTIQIPNDKIKPKVDDMKFISNDGNTELDFDSWFDENIGNSDTIQKLKTNKWMYNDD
jgi:hypothetical protein